MRAHGIAHHVAAADAEMVEQAAPILGHHRRAIKAGVVELLASSMSAMVVGDDAAGSLSQDAQPMRIAPICSDIGGEAVDEENGFSIPLIAISDPHAV